MVAAAPQAVVLLGDTFHDRKSEDRLARDDAAALRALAGMTRLIWVVGNHDSDGPRDLPGEDKIVTPTVVTVERIVYVKVPAELTRPEPIAEGPIAQCFDVAAQRRAALQRANSKLKQISEIQGTKVKP